MKRHWKLAALGLLVSTLALADNDVLNKGTYNQNATNGAKTDVSGNAYVTESQPAMDAGQTFLNVINNSALAVGSADSNAVPLDTRRMRLSMLLFKVVGATAAQTINHIAVQIRTQLNGNTDSLSTFVIYQYGSSLLGAGAAGTADTTEAGHLVAPAATTEGSGEFDLVADRARVGPNGAAATTFFYPSGIAISLQSIYGRDFYSPYTTIRVRNLTGPTCAITMHVVGTPL